jgi:hypothetical protein
MSHHKGKRVRITLRLPHKLHKLLVQTSGRYSLPFNEFATTLLGYALGGIGATRCNKRKGNT